MLSKFFVVATSRAKHYSAYNIKVLHSQYQRTSDFTTSTMTTTRKCLSYSELCRPIFAILRMLLGPCIARKLRQSVTNEPGELKLTHFNM